MGVSRTIDITAGQRKTILKLLKRYLPGTAAWVYGSRVKWTSRPQSDLDLVVFATPHQRSRTGALREAFEESDLPFRVDLFVWDEVPETFREQIELEHVVLAVDSTSSTSRNSALGGEWTESTLGEVTDFVSGGTPAKSHTEYWGGSIPWVSAKDMKRFRLNDTQDHVTEAGVDNGTKLIPEGTVLLLTRGMTLINAVPICVAQRPMTFNQDVKALRPKLHIVPDYLPYLLLGNKQRLLSLVDLAGHGTGRLNSDELKALDILLPSLPEEQRDIADILGTLDDKIELNRRTSETLEAMARALFKSWFVDFDPVLAKVALNHNSPLGGESARLGRSSQSGRWGDVRRHYSRQTLDRAKALCRKQTAVEGLLWHFLRNRQLDGYKFCRQQPIGPYIVDFACLSAKLIVEIDEGQHAERKKRDGARDRFLRAEGYRVLRFWNNEVFGDCFAVLERIHGALSSPARRQSAPAARPSATPPQGGSDWSVERARSYIDTMGPAIADLFPDCFVHSELGEIPKGWSVETLADHLEVVKGVSYKGSELNTQGVPLHNLNSIYEGGGYKYEGIKYYSGEHTEHHVVLPGDVIVANTEQGHERLLIGYAAIVPRFYGDKGVVSHHIYRVRPKSDSQLTASYLYALLNTPRMHEVVSGFANGTTVNMLPLDALQKPVIVTPPETLVLAFDGLAVSIGQRCEELLSESSTIDALREVLLPKLVSGELRIRDGEGLIERDV